MQQTLLFAAAGTVRAERRRHRICVMRVEQVRRLVAGVPMSRTNEPSRDGVRGTSHGSRPDMDCGLAAAPHPRAPDLPRQRPRRTAEGPANSRSPALLVPSNGAPGEIRTPDHQVRSLVLYPTELRAREPTIVHHAPVEHAGRHGCQRARDYSDRGACRQPPAPARGAAPRGAAPIRTGTRGILIRCRECRPSAAPSTRATRPCVTGVGVAPLCPVTM